MRKELEKLFFKPFEWQGAVETCLRKIKHKYNLIPESEDWWDEDCDNYLQEVIIRDVWSFDEEIERIDDFGDKLFEEIEDNLNECKNDIQRNKYLYSLLARFGDAPNGCGLASAVNPIHLLGRNDVSKEKQEAAENVRKKLNEITTQLDVDARCCIDGTEENYFLKFECAMYKFGSRLDALLLMYGIDMMKLQEESGIYLIKERNMNECAMYIGGYELANKYVEAIGGTKGNEPTGGVIIPDELDTEEVRNTFGEAMKLGYMKKVGGKYQWLKSNVFLSAVCGFLYCGDSLYKDDVTGYTMYKRGSVFFPNSKLSSIFLDRQGKEADGLGASRLQINRVTFEKELRTLFNEKAAL